MSDNDPSFDNELWILINISLKSLGLETSFETTGCISILWIKYPYFSVLECYDKIWIKYSFASLIVVFHSEIYCFGNSIFVPVLYFWIFLEILFYESGFIFGLISEVAWMHDTLGISTYSILFRVGLMFWNREVIYFSIFFCLDSCHSLGFERLKTLFDNIVEYICIRENYSLYL